MQNTNARNPPETCYFLHFTTKTRLFGNFSRVLCKAIIVRKVLPLDESVQNTNEKNPPGTRYFLHFITRTRLFSFVIFLKFCIKPSLSERFLLLGEPLQNTNAKKTSRDSLLSTLYH